MWKKIDKDKWDEWRREREEKARRQAEEAERRRIEKEERENLLRDMQNWRTSENLRAYINAVIESYVLKNGKVIEGSDFDHWVTWARKQVDSLDPIKNSS